MLKKTIIIPCFNEIKTIEKVINRVKKNYINQADNIVVVLTIVLLTEQRNY